LAEPKVSVIIPTLVAGPRLEQCLRGLGAQTLTGFETIVVDNSGCGAAAALARDAGARLIENRANAGFGAAVNQGIAAAGGEFICTLNDDATPDPRWLEELTAACGADPAIGMGASQIRLAGEPEKLDSAGLAIYLDGSSKQRGRMRPAAAYTAAEEVLLPSACAALYRAAMLREIGSFDPDFFLYCEDTDLGLRARRAGWRCVYVPAAVVYHAYSASAGRASLQKMFHVERNRIYLIIKNFPFWVWPLTPLFTMYRYVVHLWGLATGRGLAWEFHQENEGWWRLVIIVLSANYQALVKLPAMLGKRRQAAKTARLSGWAFWRLLRRHSISARALALEQ